MNLTPAASSAARMAASSGARTARRFVLKSTISRKSPAIADRAKALTPPTALQGREREDAASIRREKQKRPTAVLGDELDAGQPG